MNETYIKISLLDDGKVEILGSVSDKTTSAELLGMLYDINSAYHSYNMFEVLFKAAEVAKKDQQYLNEMFLAWQVIEAKFKKELSKDEPIVRPTEVFKKFSQNMGII